jgi:Cof subfamily protein (haloacid dehalogenase superfamily)
MNDLNPRIKLVVSDVDGTFVTKGVITPATLLALDQVRAQGIAVVLASSRPPRGMAHFFDIAAMNIVSTPFIGMNGAIIGNTSGEILYSCMLEPAVVQALYDAVHDTGVNVMLLDAEGWWSSAEDELVQREARALRFMPDFERFHQRLTYPANKMTLLGDPDAVAEARRRVDAGFAGQVSATSPANPRFLDITAPGVHKGTAVLRLAEMLSLKREEICAIGDGENDTEMFRVVGTSIAMGHAADAVKAQATHTTLAHDADGWAHAMERFVLGV